MNKSFKDFLLKVKNPPNWMIAVIYFVTALAIVGAILILQIDYSGSYLEIIAYCLFGVSALCLTFAVYISIVLAPKIKNKLITFLQSYKFTNNLLYNYGFKTVVFAVLSFVLNVGYGVFNGVLGILAQSIWYGALAAYYIFLALIRGGLLLYHQRKKGAKRNEFEEELKRIKTFKNCGILILFLNIALSSAIAQMIFNDEGFVYVGLTIYASAAYAFYKITMSVINFIKAKKHSDLTVEAIRNINLIDALTSILALQTALLFTFKSPEVNASLFNTFTGVLVSVTSTTIAVLMLVKARKRKKLLMEKYSG